MPSLFTRRKAQGWHAATGLVLCTLALDAFATNPPRGATSTAAAVAETRARAGRQGKVRSGSLEWNCSGLRCTITAPTSAFESPGTVCRALAREVGTIRSFKVGTRASSGGEIKECNEPGPAAPPAPARLSTVPLEITTTPLRYVGKVPLEITTPTLRYYVGNPPVEITTPTLRYVGTVPLEINTPTVRYVGRK